MFLSIMECGACSPASGEEDEGEGRKGCGK